MVSNYDRFRKILLLSFLLHSYNFIPSNTGLFVNAKEYVYTYDSSNTNDSEGLKFAKKSREEDTTGGNGNDSNSDQLFDLNKAKPQIAHYKNHAGTVMAKRMAMPSLSSSRGGRNKQRLVAYDLDPILPPYNNVKDMLQLIVDHDLDDADDDIKTDIVVDASTTTECADVVSEETLEKEFNTISSDGTAGTMENEQHNCTAITTAKIIATTVNTHQSEVEQTVTESEDDNYDTTGDENMGNNEEVEMERITVVSSSATTEEEEPAIIVNENQMSKETVSDDFPTEKQQSAEAVDDDLELNDGKDETADTSTAPPTVSSDDNDVQSTSIDTNTDSNIEADVDVNVDVYVNTDIDTSTTGIHDAIIFATKINNDMEEEQESSVEAMNENGETENHMKEEQESSVETTNENDETQNHAENAVQYGDDFSTSDEAQSDVVVEAGTQSSDGDEQIVNNIEDLSKLSSVSEKEDQHATKTESTDTTSEPHETEDAENDSESDKSIDSIEDLSSIETNDDNKQDQEDGDSSDESVDVTEENVESLNVDDDEGEKSLTSDKDAEGQPDVEMIKDDLSERDSIPLDSSIDKDENHTNDDGKMNTEEVIDSNVSSNEITTETPIAEHENDQEIAGAEINKESSSVISSEAVKVEDKVDAHKESDSDSSNIGDSQGYSESDSQADEEIMRGNKEPTDNFEEPITADNENVVVIKSSPEGGEEITKSNIQESNSETEGEGEGLSNDNTIESGMLNNNNDIVPSENIVNSDVSVSNESESESVDDVKEHKQDDKDNEVDDNIVPSDVVPNDGEGNGNADESIGEGDTSTVSSINAHQEVLKDEQKPDADADTTTNSDADADADADADSNAKVQTSEGIDQDTYDRIKQSSANQNFVSGLDDIDKFFENIDPPDELDPGADGLSLEEVLKSQGIQIIKKHLNKSMRIVKKGLANIRQRLDGQFGPSIIEPMKKKISELKDKAANVKELFVEKLREIMERIGVSSDDDFDSLYDESFEEEELIRQKLMETSSS